MELEAQEGLALRGRDTLTRTARLIGTAAGYFQRSSRDELIADAERLVKRSPEKSIMIAGAVGLMLGAVLRSGPR